ncbi:AAA family ATPase [Fundidesulfovibrio terrae]|uniref:AAA family ATPase n=1 Tax=Fundidesulfovibrio terrae TaxID=2922866 RepID=UPI001FAECB0E|nr:AAA family ATPase [Fundidesulfovibrio terrae]
MDNKMKVCIEVEDAAASRIIYDSISSRSEFSLITTFPYYADIYIIEVVDDFGNALIKIRNFLDINPALEILVISTEANHSRILEFVNTGVRGYFLLPLSINKFEASIETFAKRYYKERYRNDVHCRTISFLGAKGGTGNTSICVNTALSIQTNNDPTLLMDLHQPHGDAHVILDVDPMHTMGYLVREVHRLDASLLTDVAAKHKTGLNVLPPISHHNEIPLASVEAMSSILEVAKSIYQYIVIDHGSGLNEIDLAYLNTSEYIAITCQPDILSLRNAKLYVGFLRDYNENFMSKIRIIVNRFDSTSKLTIEDISKFLAIDVFHTIPNDYKRISSCCHSGALLHENHPDAKITKSFSDLSSKITRKQDSNNVKQQPKPRSFLRNLFQSRG